MVTPAEYERRLKRAWRWWWAAVLFFGGGAVCVIGFIIAMRGQMELPTLGGMAFLALFALQRLIFVLRRRPH